MEPKSEVDFGCCEYGPEGRGQDRKRPSADLNEVGSKSESSGQVVQSKEKIEELCKINGMERNRKPWALQVTNLLGLESPNALDTTQTHEQTHLQGNQWKENSIESFSASPLCPL